MATQKIYDCAIIGGGISGLSAALSLARMQRTVVVFDSQKYRNASSAHVHNVWGGLDGTSNADARERTRAQLRQYGVVTFIDDTVFKITRASSSENGFQFTTLQNKSVQAARQIVLAGGIRDIMPPIPGLQAAWDAGFGIHCMFCHGYEHRGQRLVSVSNNRAALHSASGIATLTKDITFLTNRAADDASQDSELDAKVKQLGMTVRHCHVSHVTFDREASTITVHFGDGSKETYDAFLVAPDSAPSEHLCPLLKDLDIDIATSEHPLGLHIETVKPTDVFGKLPSGVFAAGDFMQMIQTAPSAMLSGNMAGAGVHFALGAPGVEA